MEDIIKIAIEGGYKGEAVYYDHVHDSYLYNSEFPVSDVVLDPLFWQALGKACGWKYKAYKQGTWQIEETDLRIMSDTPFRCPEWEWQALEFHRINLTEGWDKAVTYLREVTKHPAK